MSVTTGAPPGAGGISKAVVVAAKNAVQIPGVVKSDAMIKVASRKVLDENSYTEDVAKIIQRDFFPDVQRLQAQTEYLDALEANDVRKLRELHTRYGPKLSGVLPTPDAYHTPATFDTPEPSHRNTPMGIASTSENKESVASQEADCNDDSTEKKGSGRGRYPRRPAEGEHADRQLAAMALPSIEQQAITNGSQPINTWHYTTKNTVMYPPDGAPLTADELVARPLQPREIVHDNTRFAYNPFNQRKSSEALAAAASTHKRVLHGRIGADGKELLPEDDGAAAAAAGRGYVRTPSPQPGPGATPLMTWGEIEGTPFLLDGSDVPLARTPGPSFQLPQVPRRDRLGMKLAEKSGRQHRQRKQAALQQASLALTTPPGRFGSQRSADRLELMSPAAQRLLSSKLGIRVGTDRALQASYTPSPARADATPIAPGTPHASTRTPGSGGGVAAPTYEAASITDNLLQLPKRHKASDFF
ncbi:PREDICTED: protein DGCR14-like [Priapulus caudatus]|uniref:Protein DGCR14-like n=1 Tax=Priapulus caudatus TaxID=37621 RepID=A0ABM1ERP0_PRICU|nr:PREDICTED: protein DGCR14-like [Priapulus caudatus]